MDSRSFHFRSHHSGSVLVVALISLALMMILLLALLQGTTHQIQGAQSEAALAREKLLADSAVALVMGQIQTASTQPDQTWISQPGLLRTYSRTSARELMVCYKLYSTPQLTDMIDTAGTLDFLKKDVPADWNSTANKNLYTDLNAPAQNIYPILDQNAATSMTGLSLDSGSSGVQMPVAWLYQLQDGTLGPASKGTAANPIVARIAFWTDDDTCKININTAASGSGWNTPRVNSVDDMAYGTHQPALGEYSSYPGHPATTSLAEVFPFLTPQKLIELSPRYAFGGSELGTTTTTPGESAPLKPDRLYTSIDELCFSSAVTQSDQRAPSSLTSEQIQAARFVITANSKAPETTMLGEPRVAIWPLDDGPAPDQNRMTSADRAIKAAATVGARNYFFMRKDPSNSEDDFDPMDTSAPATSNIKLFNEILHRGTVAQPGCTSTFSDKYSGAKWTQLVLEITDFIHSLNTVDPTPTPFVPFTGGSSGHPTGFVIPLTATYQGQPLRGLGRCPTLSSLTLILYVSGFGFDDGQHDIDLDDPANQSSVADLWNNNFQPSSPRWQHVNAELIRAFVVPCTFQPGCGYPEVNDDCDIQIVGLDGMTIDPNQQNPFGFNHDPNSHSFVDAPKLSPPQRAWGGNEGPLAWMLAGLDQNSQTTIPYSFAGTKAYKVTFGPNSKFAYDATSGKLNFPTTPSITFSGSTSLKVLIRDHTHTTLQTLNLDLTPASPSGPLMVLGPTIIGECDTDNFSASTGTGTPVPPYYYMQLKNRLLASQLSRAVFIQAGDVSRSIEATTDLRVIASLATVPSTMFGPHPQFFIAPQNDQSGSHAHNIRFADGTSACFATGSPVSHLVANASYAKTGITTIPAHDWTGMTSVSYPILTDPPCSSPSDGNPVVMPSGQPGDWDTGPGMSPDGAQINLPDAGTSLSSDIAYRSLSGSQIGAPTQRTPNALVPSPVIFGSLPAGIDPTNQAQSQPWRTLLFCPYPAAGANHPGLVSPPDYLLLDNFWMPTVEPYPISTCMTTSGKINLNDQIAPFTWIHRSTGLRALLHDMRIPAVPIIQAGTYKTPIKQPLGAGTVWQMIDPDLTVSQIETRFTNGSVNAYLSESEICSVPIIPKGQTADTLNSFWNGAQKPGRLTGDNLRELPYTQICSRLTTRSNSYTVHVHVQVLQKLASDPEQNTWKEGTDLVLGDWRGSYEIERYLDLSDPTLAVTPQLRPYKFRVVSCRRFAP